jgi:predicted Rossmann fold nucleotide-binding protein DprA/Smf involved in DNA uptake
MHSESLPQLVPGDSLYPQRLLSLKAPPKLYYIGDAQLANSQRTIAIIGSRHATEDALSWAQKAGRHFASEGYVVVSGLAKGVDLLATQGALETGKAVAVVPFGLISKEARARLRDLSPYLEEQLLVLSALEPYVPWKAQYAMWRNRLVVGLADVVLVVQTGLKETLKEGKKGSKRTKSGTWAAAEDARRLGRPVFVLNLLTEGNQALIREGWVRSIPPGEEGFYEIEDFLANLPQKAALPRQGELLFPAE